MNVRDMIDTTLAEGLFLFSCWICLICGVMIGRAGTYENLGALIFLGWFFWMGLFKNRL